MHRRARTVRAGTAPLTQELTDALDQDAQTRQAAHKESHRSKIQALLLRIDTNAFDEAVCQRAEKHAVEFLVDDKPTICARCTLAQIGIRLVANIECVVPPDVQCQCFNGLAIGQIMQLLQNENSENHMKVFARTLEILAQMRRDLLNRKLVKKEFSEDAPPKTA